MGPLVSSIFICSAFRWEDKNDMVGKINEDHVGYHNRFSLICPNASSLSSTIHYVNALQHDLMHN